VSGRFFPYADRPSVLVDEHRKYWFRVSGVRPDNRLCIVVTRVTDLDDRAVASGASGISPDTIPAFQRLQKSFWHFVRPVGAQRAPCSAGPAAE
jgi:hypothetical protein